MKTKQQKWILFGAIATLAQGCISPAPQQFYSFLNGDADLTNPVVDCSNGLGSCYQLGFKFDPTFSPFLAGMPTGSVLQAAPGGDSDVADERSFVYLGHSIVRDQWVMEFSATGSTNNGPSPTNNTPDGTTESLFSRGHAFPGTSENNITFTTAPRNALMGVFLTETVPALYPEPAVNEADCPLVYDTDEKKNRLVYRPKIQQLFFIGDGKTDSGQVQKFIVPAGATRLYLTNMDEWEWNNNWGNFSISVRSRAP